MKTASETVEVSERVTGAAASVVAAGMISC